MNPLESADGVIADRSEVKDFELAELTKLDPSVLLSEAGDDPVGACFLTLALIFNDIKGIGYYHGWLLRYTPDPTEVSAFSGQWGGMLRQLERLSCGMLWELLTFIREQEEVVNSSAFRGLLASVPTLCRTNWKVLQSLALDEKSGARQKNQSLTKALLRIRNSAAFHYYNPKALVNGYRLQFFGSEKDERNAFAYASIGKNMEETRFYYADAAAQTLVTQQAEAAGATSFLEQIGVTLHQVNMALGPLLFECIGDRRRTKGLRK